MEVLTFHLAKILSFVHRGQIWFDVKSLDSGGLHKNRFLLKKKNFGYKRVSKKHNFLETRDFQKKESKNPFFKLKFFFFTKILIFEGGLSFNTLCHTQKFRIYSPSLTIKAWVPVLFTAKTRILNGDSTDKVDEKFLKI